MENTANTYSTNGTFLPVFLSGWLQLIVPEDCFNEFFVKLNFLHVQCLKILISKCLGYGIIAGSCIVKLPQIVKILQAKNGQGISLLSVSLELVAISASWAYGKGHQFPFSAYGEALFLAIQTSLTAYLVLYYSNQTAKGLVYVSSYAIAMAFLLSPSAPTGLLAVLQGGNIFLVSISKIIQALANYRNGSTGQLSVITVYLLFLGSIARIFTSIQETGDAMTIATYCVSSFFNGIIAAQFIHYWKVKQA
ncbi:mannose-P-dolichol utilization defect 1 protein-like [Physella acuta]|uniref:mannose-P-dolichol utilization defect 1 protein-like n=1 Tax=Physella acuta TaxID=109671 RepID=UPI0027DBE440|nr:mannose-P-dolichol utilization defect 1 protein-like [Physella acuta]